MDATHFPANGAPATIGPNAIIRMGEAIEALEGAPVAKRIFQAAGIEQYLTTPPGGMVPAADVAALHRALHTTLGDARARTAGWVAGQRTAEYLLENRIPAVVRKIMRVVPPPIAARLLAAMITRNAWTFAGTGRVRFWFGSKAALVTISRNPICDGTVSAEPYCDYYAATFERLFAALVHDSTRVVETHCTALGAPECVFEIHWPGLMSFWVPRRSSDGAVGYAPAAG